VPHLTDKKKLCGLYYKLIMIVNDDSLVVNKLEAFLTDDTRGVIYNRHMFIVQATGHKIGSVDIKKEPQLSKRTIIIETALNIIRKKLIFY
jgi:hypothetical protein